MEEGRKQEAAAFGFPAPVQPGATRVGWIGIGVMGGAMAKRLLAAGYAVTAYARTPSKADSLVASGASLADSPRAVAAASDVVFTMVGNPGDVRAVVLDPATGALAGLRRGGVLVDCTSSSPSLAREVAAAAAAAGCHAVDAPVSGGDVGARDGTLALFAGGDEAVVAWLAPLFAHLGKATHMGGPGSGQSSKIANQIAVAGAVVGLGESVAFAGAEPRRCSSARCPRARRARASWTSSATACSAVSSRPGAACGTSSRTSAWRWRSGTAGRTPTCCLEPLCTGRCSRRWWPMATAT